MFDPNVVIPAFGRVPTWNDLTEEQKAAAIASMRRKQRVTRQSAPVTAAPAVAHLANEQLQEICDAVRDFVDERVGQLEQRVARALADALMVTRAAVAAIGTSPGVEGGRQVAELREQVAELRKQNDELRMKFDGVERRQSRQGEHLNSMETRVKRVERGDR